jgi:F0F1-type ATP synthase membrane subunit a
MIVSYSEALGAFTPLMCESRNLNAPVDAVELLGQTVHHGFRLFG